MNSNLKAKVQTFENLSFRQLERHQQKMQEIQEIIEVIKLNSSIAEGDNLQTVIFKKYLEHDNVHKVAKCINEKGHRIPTKSHIGERKYNSNDITKIIKSPAEDVEPRLRAVVKRFQSENYKAMMKRWG